MKRKKSSASNKHTTRLVPTLLGTLILLIVTGLLLNIFVFGIGANNSERVQAAVTETVTFFPMSPTDYMNEDGKIVQSYTSSPPSTVWFGTGQNTSNSYLGLRLTSTKPVPAGAQIVSAYLDLTPKTDSWIGINSAIYAETAVSPAPFSNTSKPSQRLKTSVSKAVNDNAKWLANRHYKYDVTSVIQSLPNAVDRSMISILVKGGGVSWGRKYVNGGISNDTRPQLLVTYRILTSVSPTPGNGQPTSAPIPTTPPQPTSVTQPTSGQMPTSMQMPTTMPSADGYVPAASFGLWDPADPKYAAAGPQKYATCTKAFHDSFYVIASDGKKYPTWHPPVAVDPSTGKKCSFGHEHGKDPSQSGIWNIVQQHFYYDANKNGVMDSSEQAVSGIPFGYANEQLDVYSQSKNLGYMRHEDHVGHKVAWANGEADTDGGSFNSNTSGGVIVPIIRQSNGFKWTDSGAKCYYFAKIHQGVSTFDAFTNNLHEVIYFSDCKGPNTGYDQTAGVTEMVAFGAPGEFTNLCTADGDRTSPVVVGKDANNSNFPGTRGSGTRSIIQRNCIEKYFLVPQGQFSMNMYEEWDQSMGIQLAGGKTVLSGINLAFDVEEANRYYYPGKPNNIGYSMDLCYEAIAGGRQARGGICDAATNYGSIKGITWNDTRSAFKGIHRGNYFMPPNVNNAGGSTIIYTDPYGKNGQTTPFPGSIKQLLANKSIDYSKLGPTDPRQVDVIYDDGEGTVHAPN